MSSGVEFSKSRKLVAFQEVDPDHLHRPRLRCRASMSPQTPTVLIHRLVDRAPFAEETFAVLRARRRLQSCIEDTPSVHLKASFVLIPPQSSNFNPLQPRLGGDKLAGSTQSMNISRSGCREAGDNDFSQHATNKRSKICALLGELPVAISFEGWNCR